MFPILIGFGSALLFGIFAYGTYGAAGLAQYNWIAMVFWGLVGTSLLVLLVNCVAVCSLGRLGQRFGALQRICSRLSPSP